ncbi:16S rRNA (guanine(966)-N(2))-methyltransferase RsmD [bacterium (Candidatus Blackallbacteria) CG17_big_fil_post_rev_8_21_14_2_50_48_46]|uniref:16S rRNA (Guanine(966)-N(2))-methyltransferase RsmD n=1 Tax=bacterium (Candidatus Blackallbacteria) CG17_big_fil_post_rev_8_21_14_2_50_48_46 TaxID=2014261 RepID=A0A2M7G6M9_9BACT|nr:MAG: 16S rRNA (guanine(966)-N(2))-methyltransferase RsmD [bacterium (Candidatus Blackallbacteria) CG18_big_fil_WC_8_21_14_2_50_49_26]PIW17668.1 MAG: 16S rRNA (guanine(966)-N(2))-methyltransferase RsmD [bacterium (Candidatus Blackallbacteria) CG17_big_fil_post_rev_8_21_14_2_50_48_46]PIW50113.1 MAG: 16S rRNA (guanine(966)-N(2))-methyltransferase RsmD [bacterium (Candidatus Blackallbacteria) CG13_big_fil_rev_8_21_14_2_50_49_14]
MLRISGGEWRNRSLKWLDIPEIRPTSAKVREALFQILKDELVDAVCWDLCAGSGIMGFEALSRGAEKVIFVEKNKRAAGLIRQNIEKFEIQAQAQVIPADLLVFLRRSREPVDLIYIDPPYASPVYRPLMQVLDQTVSEWGKPNTKLCIEHRKDRQLELETLQNWQFQQTRNYGDTRISFFIPRLSET